MKNELSLLKKENRLREQYLPKEEQDKIQRMLRYMSSKQIGTFELEVTHKELIGMALEGMQRGEILDQVLGQEENVFCDSVVENSRRRSIKDHVIDIIGRFFMYYGAVVLVYSLTLNFHGSLAFDKHLLIFVPLWSLICAMLGKSLDNRFIYEVGWKKYIPTLIMSLFLVIAIGIQEYFNISTLFYINKGVVWGVIGVGVVLGKVIYDSYIHNIAKQYRWQD